MKRPFFSVIIPTFNQSNFLDKSLRSVLDQSFKSFEIIVVDNFSTDSTEKIIKSFKNKIVYKKIKKHGIIAKSRNKGIQLSKGKWVAFLDSDDLWTRNKLNEVYKKVQKNEYDVICNDEWIKYGQQPISSLWSYGPYKNNFYKKLLIDGNCISTSASVINKSFLLKNKIKFNENKAYVTTEDYDFFLNISKKNGKFCFFHKPLGVHLFHDRSASYNYIRYKKSLLAVLNHHVFKVQSFTSQKKKLWKQIKLNIELIEILTFLYRKHRKHKTFQQISKILIRNPLKFLIVFFKDIYNKFKRFILYNLKLIIYNPKHEKN